MSIISTGRSLLSLLQPLTGARSLGTATVKSSPGGSATLPAHSIAVPIIGGAMRFDRLLKVKENPATQPEGGWTVVAAGTSVPMISIVGGADMNIPAGTEIRWWPSIDGIEAKSLIPGAMGGAGEPSGLASLKSVAFFEQLRADLSGAAIDMFKSMVSQYPAAILVWEDSGPADGNAIDLTAKTSARVGRGIFLYQHSWDLFIISSRTDGDPQRREEGLALLEAMTELLQDATSADGLVFSNPQGVRIVRRQRWLVSPTFYVYRIQLVTVEATKRREARTFNDWTLTTLDVQTPDQQPLTTIYQNKIPMP